jgi:hypothetical protein
MSTLVKRPTEVRQDESMLEEFKRQIRIAQTQNPAPDLVNIDPRTAQRIG